VKNRAGKFSNQIFKSTSRENGKGKFQNKKEKGLGKWGNLPSPVLWGTTLFGVSATTLGV